MPQLAPIAKQAFFDSNGDPLAAGLLYTYATGTSTPKTTYSDNAATPTANANPIVLDSRGECDIWLDSDAPYRFVLKTSAGVTIWTRDSVTTTLNGTPVVVATVAAMKALTGGAYPTVQVLGYASAGDGGGGLFRWNSADSSTDNGGTIIAPNAGGTGRWNRIYDQAQAINVRWFGALGDAVTDDAAAIQRAQDFVETLVGATYNAAALYFPSPKTANKYYLVNSKLKVDKVCRWIGDHQVGTILCTTSNGVTILEVKKITATLSDPVEHFTALDIYFRGSGAGSTVPGVIFENVHRSILERCAIFAFDIGWQLKGGSAGGAQSSYSNTARGCRIDSCNSIGVDAQKSTNLLTLDTCQIGACPKAVKVVDSTDPRIINCDIESNTTLGIEIDEVATTVSALNVCAMIQGNHFEGNTGRDIKLGTTNVVNGVNIIGNTFGSTALTKPIDAIKAANLNVIGNLGFNWTSASLITVGTVNNYVEMGNIVNVFGAAAHAEGTVPANTVNNLTTFPKQSAFLATLTAQAANVTGDATAYTIAFGTEISDQASDFATPNFTARPSALHRFNACVKIGGLAAGHTLGLLELVTTIRTYELWRGNPAALRDTGNFVTLSASTFANMSSGDTAFLRLTITGGAKAVSVETASYFSGGTAS